MREREAVPLRFKEPPEWPRFIETVAAEHGGYASPYAGVAIEQAWREYREEHPSEEYADRLLRAVGRRDRHTREKKLTQETATGGNPATVRVRKGVKEDMKAYATEAGVPAHVVLRAVVCWYLGGGLLGRLTEKLGRAVPEAEDQLADRDPSADRGQTAIDKKREWLARRMADRPMFTLTEFGEALEAMPYRGGDTDHMREQHLETVLSRIHYAEHPAQTDLYLPEEDAEEAAESEGIDPDAPAINRTGYTDMSGEERVHGLRVEIAQRAAKRSNGKRALRAGEVRSEVFDGTPGKRKTKDLMDRAAHADGFETDGKGGEKRLTVDLRAVEDPDVFDAVDREGSSPGPAVTEDVDVELDRLMEAEGATPEARTDGGEE